MLNGMQQMLAGMLKEAIPEEVQSLLTPEKMKELGDKVTAFITDVRERLETLEHLTINNQRRLDEIIAFMKDTPNNDGHNDSNGTDTGTGGRRRNRKSPGAGSD